VAVSSEVLEVPTTKRRRVEEKSRGRKVVAMSIRITRSKVLARSTRITRSKVLAKCFLGPKRGPKVGCNIFI
jgi:hypothetical protein